MSYFRYRLIKLLSLIFCCFPNLPWLKREQNKVRFVEKAREKLAAEFDVEHMI